MKGNCNQCERISFRYPESRYFKESCVVFDIFIYIFFSWFIQITYISGNEFSHMHDFMYQYLSTFYNRKQASSTDDCFFKTSSCICLFLVLLFIPSYIAVTPQNLLQKLFISCKGEKPPFKSILCIKKLLPATETFPLIKTVDFPKKVRNQQWWLF